MGVAGGGYGMWRGRRRLQWRRLSSNLYVTQYGRSILYRNNGDGTFTDVTEKARVATPGWAASAVWFDYDNDGRLDLFRLPVLRFRRKSKHHNCLTAEIFPESWAWRNIIAIRESFFAPMPSWLFHNNGDGTFTDVSQESGIAANPGKAWGRQVATRYQQ